MNTKEMAKKVWLELAPHDEIIPMSTSFRFTEEGDWDGVWVEVTINEDGTMNLHLNNLEFERGKQIVKEFGST